MILTATVLLLGCGTESYDMSDNVRFLWEQHPMPFSPEAADAAAKDADGLLTSNKRDFQLKIYYVERMGTAHGDSIVAITQAELADDPNNARKILLESLAVGGRNRTADSLRRALELAPEDPYILAYASAALLRSRPAEPEKALTLAEKATQIAPNYSEAYASYAQALLENEMPEKAIEASDKAIELAPWDYFPVRTKVFALEQLEHGDEALALLEEFAQKQPIHPYLLYDLGRRYEEAGTLEKLVDLQVMAAEINPQDGWAWLEVADLHARMGNYDEMIEAYQNALEADFYDLELITHQMDAEVARAIRNRADWKELKQAMLDRRKETADDRKAEALSVKLDKPAPEILARTLEGEEVKLSDFRGEVVVLDFWATWCPPCRLTLPRLKDLYESGIDVNLVSVDVWERIPDEQRPEYVGEFAREEGMVWNVWLAPNSAADEYEVRGIPTFVVIDGEGVIRYQLVGYNAFLDETLAWMIEDVQNSGEIAMED
jgi:thiol-disulfide isomerase/thioredoxin/Flp pilus assembly protein TadD